MKHRSGNNNSTSNQKLPSKTIYDEKEQVEIISRYRQDAATFDRVIKWVFLGLSIVLSGAAIFVVARFDAKDISTSLSKAEIQHHMKIRSGDNTETAFRHWFVVFIGLCLITFGSLVVMRFRPDKDWGKWMNVSDNTSRKDNSKFSGSDNDDEKQHDEDSELKFFLQQNKNQNFSFLKKYGCLFISLCLLAVQLLYLAANKEIYPPEEKWSVHYIFYHCASSILAVAHAGCWPILLQQMSTTQKDLKALESKKYRISDA